MTVKTYTNVTKDIDLSQLSQEIEDALCIAGFNGCVHDKDCVHIIGASIANETVLDTTFNDHVPVE